MIDILNIFYNFIHENFYVFHFPPEATILFHNRVVKNFKIGQIVTRVSFFSRLL